MKKRHFFTLLAIFLLFSAIAISGLALSSPVHQASSVVLADANTGDILYVHNPHQRVHPASTTKIMTTLLAVEAMDRGEFSIGDSFITTETALYDMIPAGAAIGLELGEEMSFEALLYAIMLISANDASNVVAEYVGGSIPGFLQMMNDRARELGAENTNFTNAHGLTDDDHFSTAYDMFLIAQAAIANPRFMEIATAVDRPHAATNLRPAGIFTNTNLMADPESPHYFPGLAGVKTGFTNAAGFCLISTATRDDVSLLAVVMGVSAGVPAEPDGPTHFTETAAIYTWAFENFSYTEILSTFQEVERIPVSMGDGADTVGLRPAESITVLMQRGSLLAERATQEIVLFHDPREGDLMAPINQGDILGEIILHYDDRRFGPIPLVAAETVRLSRMAYIQYEITSTLDNLWVRVVIGVLLLLVLLYIIYAIQHAIGRRRRRARLRRR